MELRPSPNCVSIVPVLQLEKSSSCLYESSYKYQPILGDMQSSRTVTLALMLFMPQTLKKEGIYWFRLVRMYVCMYVRTYVCIHVRDIVLKLHVWIPHGKIVDAYFWFSLNYLPLSNYGPLTNKGMKFCKCRISKSIIARNLKLVSADR